jgi:enoyl-[acyl-carrier protein] reductase II
MNRVTQLYGIRYPLIQAGMIWCSDWRLASAVSQAGGLGLIGSGSMVPEGLREQIRLCKKATDKPFGVNLPLLYPHADEHVRVILEEGVSIVFTSAGNPKKYTSLLKGKGILVTHVVASVRFAMKCQEAGVDAIVAEGFEAGGHNGIEETTTFCLLPQVREAVSLPLIAAGGIATGRGMLAAFALGAEGIQIGTRFVASVESPAHQGFKEKVVEAGDGDTMLILKKLVPVRVIRNRFYEQIRELEERGAGPGELNAALGHGRARKGMAEGDLEEGELEIGQVAGSIRSILPAATIVEQIIREFNTAREEIAKIIL